MTPTLLPSGRLSPFDFALISLSSLRLLFGGSVVTTMTSSNVRTAPADPIWISSPLAKSDLATCRFDLDLVGSDHGASSSSSPSPSSSASAFPTPNPYASSTPSPSIHFLFYLSFATASPSALPPSPSPQLPLPRLPLPPLLSLTELLRLCLPQPELLRLIYALFSFHLLFPSLRPLSPPLLLPPPPPLLQPLLLLLNSLWTACLLFFFFFSLIELLRLPPRPPPLPPEPLCLIYALSSLHILFFLSSASAFPPSTSPLLLLFPSDVILYIFEGYNGKIENVVKINGIFLNLTKPV